MTGPGFRKEGASLPEVVEGLLEEAHFELGGETSHRLGGQEGSLGTADCVSQAELQSCCWELGRLLPLTVGKGILKGPRSGSGSSDCGRSDAASVVLGTTSV